MKFLVDDKHLLRTVDEVYTFVTTKMAPTKSVRIVLSEKDQPIENAAISVKILKLMKLTKDQCKVPEVIVDFKFEGTDDTFSVSLKTDLPVEETTEVKEEKKESLMSKINIFKSKDK